MARATAASTASAPTTNIWQQRMAARQKEEEARRHSASPNGESQFPISKPEQPEDRTAFKSNIHAQNTVEPARGSF